MRFVQVEIETQLPPQWNLGISPVHQAGSTWREGPCLTFLVSSIEDTQIVKMG